ncbi:hypothetical protein GDO81_023499 [Engystomops pustulosus]|uniref:THD domain-containing protein n=1 Tax=Engystomops pustulosus TaxID=76066 RepID=A0AAV6YVH1_ENGPU|nr:hypothetical protein GDO81_023499 [Engystomops pustulosus]
MELTQVRSEEPLLQNVQRSRTSCFHWLSICSFVILLGTTLLLALLHFKVIKTENQDEFQMPPVPEVLQIKNYLESVPKTQALTGKRAAAHLKGKRKDGHIEWRGDSANAFRDGSIKFDKNRLEIQEDGLYFVYSQVVFTGMGCAETQELSHSVYKIGYSGRPVVILQSSKTVCEVTSRATWTQPLYQGGLFKLDRGDVLYTATKNVTLLDANHGQVYFGILAV